MRYEQPIVIDLGARAAHGQDPLGCVDGPSPGSGVCSSGTGGSSSGDYLPGGSASGPNAACLTGPSAGFECGAGGAPSIGGSCNSGPAVA